MNAPHAFVPSSEPQYPRAAAFAKSLQEDIKAALGRKRLHQHLKNIWPIIEPGAPFKDNWHLGAICEHLEAVSMGQIRRLLINMPPRMLKSILVSVAWMTWDWINHPELRWIFASYAAALSTRDSLKCRNVIRSPFYQRHYGDAFTLTSDQNAKTRFENDHTGLRLATSVGGLGTGEGGDRIVVDDAHNVIDAESDLVREGTLTWWDETMSTRYNDPQTGAAVAVMQRSHHRDFSGHVLAQNSGWVHLCLPMRYEHTRQVYVGGKIIEQPTQECATPLGFKDPRSEEGELLHPARFDEANTARLEKELGTYGTAGQLQQRPSPRGGAIFKRARFGSYLVLPKFTEVLISVDCSFKDTDSSDYVAIQAWGKKGPDKYLVHRVKQRMGFAATCTAVRSVCAKYPSYIACVIEDKANGPAVVETLQKEIPRVIAVNPEGGKLARAYAVEPEQEAGNVYLPDPSIAPWIEDWLTEVCSFPASPNDDEVDSFTQALNWFRTRDGSMGFLVYARQQMEQIAQAKQLAEEVEI